MRPFPSRSDPRKVNASVVKVMGVGESAFLVELVGYDTVRTLKGILANHLLRVGDSRSAEVGGFAVYAPFPRQRLDRDESATLGDLGLVPNGVLHLAPLL